MPASRPMSRTDPQDDTPLERVVVENVSKRYGRSFALARVSLTVERGRPCVLMGENGAGKSTLIRLLSTSTQPDHGRVRYMTAKGELTGRALRRRLGFVTHQPMVYPELSALENVTFFARLGGVSGAREAAWQMIRAVGLDPASPKPAAQMSRGMGARLSAARALVTRPELLLLDEATSGLDREGRRTLLDLVLGMAGDAVVLMASHHVDNAALVARQLVILRRGRVAIDEIFDGEPDARREDAIARLLEARP